MNLPLESPEAVEQRRNNNLSFLSQELYDLSASARPDEGWATQAAAALREASDEIAKLQSERKRGLTMDAVSDIRVGKFWHNGRVIGTIIAKDQTEEATPRQREVVLGLTDTEMVGRFLTDLLAVYRKMAENDIERASDPATPE